MFDYIEYIGCVESNTNKYIYKYEIHNVSVDGTRSVFRTSLICRRDDVPSLYARAAAIIQTYTEQKISVAPNLAKYIQSTGYSKQSTGYSKNYLSLLETDMNYYFPDIAYNKYSRCVERHLLKLKNVRA